MCDVEIIRGKHRGKKATLHQYANDWMTVDIEGGRSSVVKPTDVKLTTEEERARFDQAALAENGTLAHAGSFFREWKLCEDGTFRRKARIA